MKTFFKRWSIDVIRDRLFDIPSVSDVLTEQPMENRYQIHLFVREQAPGLEDEIKKAVGRVPNGTKVDVHIYNQ